MGLASQKFFNAADGCWYEITPTLQNDDGRWITVHPSGKDNPEDYRRVKVEEGETSREAVERKFGKDKKEEPEKKTETATEPKKEEVKEQKPEEKKEEAKPSHPFGDDVKVTHSERGMFYKTKGTDKYVSPHGEVEVETFDHNGKDAYRVVPFGGSIRTFSTKSGMEKYVYQCLHPKSEMPTEVKNLEEASTKYHDTLKKYNEAESKRWKSEGAEWARAVLDAEKYKKQLTQDRREYAESIMGNFESQGKSAYEERQEERRERYEDLSDRYAKQSEATYKHFRERADMIPFGEPIHSQTDRNRRNKIFSQWDKSIAEGKKSDYYAGKAESVGRAGISADDANAIQKLAEKYKHTHESAEKRRIIDRVISIHETALKNKKLQEEQASGNYQNPYADLGFDVERNTDINRLQLKFDGKPDEATRSILKSYGFRWSPREGAWQRQLGSNADWSLKAVAEKLRNK